MRVLVTGSSGFVGRWVVRTLLAHEIESVGLDKYPPLVVPEGFQFEACDILDRGRLCELVRRTSPDVVVHLAARTDLDERHDIRGYSANTAGVMNLIDAAMAIGVQRIIYTSTQLVCKVGHVPSTDTEYCPDTLYGASKAASEELIRKAHGGAPEWCIVRPTTVWGPHMSPHYQSMLRLIQRGLYFHCGSGPLLKSYVYSENIAHQYLQLVSTDARNIHGRVFYLGDPVPLSLRDYANNLARELGAPRVWTMPLLLARLLARIGDTANRLGMSSIPFNTFRLRNILTEYQFDVSPIHRICGPMPVSIDEGIRRTAQWFLESQRSESSRK